MLKNIVIAVLLVLLGATYVSADSYPNGAPVQVQLERNRNILMYSCFPSDGGGELMVFLNLSSGLAMYECDFSAETWITPLPQRNDILISF